MHQPAHYKSINNDYQKFRPRYPIDPFQDSLDGPSKQAFLDQQTRKEPWRLDVDKLPPVELTKLCRTVILILGEPPSGHLLPLLKSRHFFSSLIIVVTHAPIYLPAGVFPTVRILKLNEPLEVENQGAERLVRTLEWAERVARVWRAHGGGGVSELQEATELAQLTEAKLQKGPRQESTGSLSRPRPSASAPNVLRSTTRPPSTLGVPGVQSPPLRSSKSRRASQFLPRPDPSQRGFDVLVNFLPATGIPDGYLLKNAILVTTISRPFVIATSPEDPTKKKMRTQSSLGARRGSKWSLFRQSAQKSASLPITPLNASTSTIGLVGQRTPSVAASKNAAPSIASSRYPTSTYTANSTLHQTFSNSNPALVIHVLPSPPPHPHNYVYTQKQLAARNKLVASIDSFLSAFGASQASFLPSVGKAHYESQGTLRGDDKRAFATGAIPRARPYIVDGNSFANDVLNATGDGEGEWSLAELLCCACLDPNPAPNLGEGKREHRVWISGISDIIISSSSASGSVGDMTPRSLTPEDDVPRFRQQPDLPSSSQPTLVPQPRVSRPLPVPQPYHQHHQQTLSSPSPSSAPHPSNPPKFTINGDSASEVESNSSHGFSGTTSPVPPTPPEKDYYDHNRGWERVGVDANGYPTPGPMPIMNGSAHPQMQTQYNTRSRYYSNEGKYPHPMVVSQSMPIPIPRASSGRPVAGESFSPQPRGPLSYNGPRPMTYHPPSTTSPEEKKKSLRWKFWK